MADPLNDHAGIAYALRQDADGEPEGGERVDSVHAATLSQRASAVVICKAAVPSP